MARTLKQQIRKIIKEHYGEGLGMYRGEDSHKIMDAFVNALARAIKPGCELPVDCMCELVNFDGHPSPNDIYLGKRIRFLRLQKGMSLEKLAARMGMQPNYLSELERGKLTPNMDIYDIIARASKATHEEKKFLMQDIDEKAETEAWIRYAIAMYFGRSLWTFHPEVSYEESVTPFVQALIGLDKAGQHAVEPSPILPPFGYMVEAEDKKRKVVPGPASAPLVCATFEAISNASVLVAS